MLAAFRRNKAARDFKRFSSFIKTPSVIGGGGFIMPANGRIGLSSSASTTAGQLRMVAGTRTFSFGALAANQIARSDWIEKGKVVNFQSDVPGTVKLLLFDEWMKPYQIGSRTF